MTQHAFCVTMSRICAYLIDKTKTVTVGFVWRAEAFVSSSVLYNSDLACDITPQACCKARVSYDTTQACKTGYSQVGET